MVFYIAREELEQYLLFTLFVSFLISISNVVNQQSRYDHEEDILRHFEKEGRNDYVRRKKQGSWIGEDDRFDRAWQPDNDTIEEHMQIYKERNTIRLVDPPIPLPPDKHLVLIKAPRIGHVPAIAQYQPPEIGPPFIEYSQYTLPEIGGVQGNSTIAEQLFHTVRVICWIPSSPFKFYWRSIYVLLTWAKRCNKIFFFMSASGKDPKKWKERLKKRWKLETDIDYRDYAQENLIFVEMDTFERGSWDLTKKVMTSWTYLHENHQTEADWFIKMDDDTFLIMENLRYFLSKQDPQKLQYFGHRFRIKDDIEYHSGGAGYVMSSRTLQHLVTNYEDRCEQYMNGGVEDIAMGRCMREIGVRAVDARDDHARAYFFPMNHYVAMAAKFPAWFYQYDKISSKHKGITGLPVHSISFHYITHRMMELEWLLYSVKVYGGGLKQDFYETWPDWWTGDEAWQDVWEREEAESERMFHRRNH